MGRLTPGLVTPGLTPAVTPAAQARPVAHRRPIDPSELSRRALQMYRSCDRDASGRLHWDNGEIQERHSALGVSSL